MRIFHFCKPSLVGDMEAGGCEFFDVGGYTEENWPTIDTFSDYARQLAAHGVWVMPFDFIYIEAKMGSDAFFGGSFRRDPTKDQIQLRYFDINSGEFLHLADMSAHDGLIHVHGRIISARFPRDKVSGIANIGFRILDALVGFLAARTELPEKASVKASLNERRVRQGRAKIVSHYVVALPAIVRRSADAPGGTHAPPHLHWRRGHVRRLEDGRLVNVRPCLVGVGSEIARRHYKLAPPQEIADTADRA